MVILECTQMITAAPIESDISLEPNIDESSNSANSNELT